VTVPEGYTGDEAPVCFVLADRSSQIWAPEPVRGFEQAGLTHAGEEACDLGLVTFFMRALVSEKFVISQRSMHVLRGEPYRL